MNRRCVCIMVTLLVALLGNSAARAATPPGPKVVVASKDFTEGVILGEVARFALKGAGFTVEHRRRFGGTTFCFKALESGQVDVYADYTGTLIREVLSGLDIDTEAQLRAVLNKRGLRMTRSLGFEDKYGLGMREKMADELGIRTISDLKDHPGLRLGFAPEFVVRADCWPGLKPFYHLPQGNPTTMEHEAAYAALARGGVDLIDVYTTDAKIARYGVRVLEDDRSFFPEYQAVYVYRADLDQRMVGETSAASVLKGLEGKLSVDRVIQMNLAVDKGGDAGEVAAKWVRENLSIHAQARTTTLAHRLWETTLEHLLLVVCAMGAGIVVALPLGYLAFVRPRVGQGVMAVTGIFQTIPALALLMFMLPLLGIGATPAIAALFLYSLLPMVRGAYTGLASIPPSVHESARALGLGPWARLWRVEAPLALPATLAGIKTATVIIIGFATLGAFIGAGGYGDPIRYGLSLNRLGLIFEGAVPAAVMALIAHGLFELFERLVVPRGLRLARPG